MRKLLTAALLALCTLSAAQEKRVFFFADFVNTLIQYKSGQKFRVKANYDMANRKMMYMQGERLMELTDAQLVDTIFTDGYAWVHHDGHFCQVADSEDGHRVLLGWHVVSVHDGYVGAYGISQTPSRKVQLGSDFGLGSLSGQAGGMYNGTYGTNADDGNGRNLDVWRKKSCSTYYFVKNGREYAVQSLKGVYKAFPEHKEEIKRYVKAHHLDMTTAVKALRIIDYIMMLGE